MTTATSIFSNVKSTQTATFSQNVVVLPIEGIKTLTVNYDNLPILVSNVKVERSFSRGKRSSQTYEVFRGDLQNLTFQFKAQSSDIIESLNIDIGDKVSPAVGHWILTRVFSSDPPVRIHSFGKQLSNEELAFCDRLGVLQYLSTADQLVRNHFSSNRKVKFELEKDVETEDEWLVIEVDIEGEIQQVLDQYDKYTKEWVKSVPWPERDRIRLIYNIF